MVLIIRKKQSNQKPKKMKGAFLNMRILKLYWVNFKN